MAMTALGSLLAMLAGLVRDLAQLAASPSGLTALAATVLAGAMLVAVIALLTSVAGVSRTPPPSRWSGAPARCGRSPGGRRSCANAIRMPRAGPDPEHPRRP